MSMNCRQCEQTAHGTGCMVAGVCGKTPETDALLHLLVHALKGVAVYGALAREVGVRNAEVDRTVIEGLFTTVTNVNFDPERIIERIAEAYALRTTIEKEFSSAYKKKAGKAFDAALPAAAHWKMPDSRAALVAEGERLGVHGGESFPDDIKSLREILLLGIKGMAAYADHARVLGVEDETVNAFFHKALSVLAQSTVSADELLNLVMECGKVNLTCMEILDRANTGRFGHPVPTPVQVGVKRGPAIIVTGHDLDDLGALLEQSAGKGVSIYTHGEMLPAHGYPGLKKYPHLVGHFGTAWQNQQKEFDGIPAVVLFTTNCIQKPRESYAGNVFTTGLVAWPGVAHIAAKKGKKDFSPVIEKALALGGFAGEKIEKTITVGFGHDTLEKASGKVLELVNQGKLKHIFLIGGCDGAKPGRNYYTDFAAQVPKDAVILTLACGKFRFNMMDFGDIDGLPRLIDCGQCNDAYSAIVTAVLLAKTLKCTVNDLPLSLILSWYEQKAVCILLTLLYLGIKNIRLGPTLPAFVSPNVLNILVEKFAIKPITTPEKDLADILS